MFDQESLYCSFYDMIILNKVLKRKIVEQTIETITSNDDDWFFSSSIINLCHYIAKTYENDFMLAVCDSGLIFSGQMIAIKLQVW